MSAFTFSQLIISVSGKRIMKTQGGSRCSIWEFDQDTYSDIQDPCSRNNILYLTTFYTSTSLDIRLKS